MVFVLVYVSGSLWQGHFYIKRELLVLASGGAGGLWLHTSNPGAQPLMVWLWPGVSVLL